MSTFRMPSLGADMEAGKLVEWLAKPGDKVKRGDIIAVVETQKGAIEIEVFEDGMLDQQLVDVGTTVPVGTPLAEIRAPGEAPAAPVAAAPAVAKKPPPVPAAAPPPKPPAPPTPRPAAPRPPPPTRVAPAAPAIERPERLRVSPAARQLAAERGIDVLKLAGSGPGGTVVYADVEAAAAAKPAPAAPPPAAPSPAPAPAAVAGAKPAAPEKPAAATSLDQMRAAIAAAMSRSKREIPHYYLAHTFDVGAAQDFVARVNATRPPDSRLLIGALLVKAVARAARKFPEFNGFHGASGFEKSQAIHVGVAIAIRGGGLVAPAIHDTADLDLDTVMAKMRDLVARVRAGRFRSSEIADPTITVSSLGERGVEEMYAVIYPPQVAIIGAGKVVERPWIVDGVVVPRPVMTLTLSADHRVSDGHRGALFLAHIDSLLQQPEAL